VDAPYGRLEPLEAGIARLLAHNPSPFTFTGTQTYFVGEREIAIVDPGPDDPRHLDSLAAAIAGRPVAAILVTHTHRDHSPAARPLAQLTRAPILGCAPLALEQVGPRADAAFDGDYRPDRELRDGETVTVDGRTLTAIATPGHTSNHLCFADEHGALFTGDHVMAWSTTVVVPPDGDMADYMTSLQKLQARDDRIYYPAHGPAVEKPRQLIRGMLGHRMQRERQILRILKVQPRTIPLLVDKAYPGLNPRLLPAAGGTVLAHLMDLERRGLVSQLGDTWTAH
jgi:glyoxylase-like metal-dependent hydrolase (beta-lactamase superfamily II)